MTNPKDVLTVDEAIEKASFALGKAEAYDEGEAEIETEALAVLIQAASDLRSELAKAEQRVKDRLSELYATPPSAPTASGEEICFPFKPSPIVAGFCDRCGKSKDAHYPSPKMQEAFSTPIDGSIEGLAKRLNKRADEIDRAVSRDKNDRDNGVFGEIELMREAAEELEQCGGLKEWRRLMGEIREYEQDYQRLQGEVERLREALRPLAAVASWQKECRAQRYAVPDDVTLSANKGLYSTTFTLTADNFNNARAALTQDGGA